MEHPLAALSGFLAPHTRVLFLALQHDIDTLATLATVADWAVRHEKNVECVVPGLESWPNPVQSDISLQSAVGPFRTLELRIPLDKATLNEVSYAVENDALRLSLTPKSGMWHTDDVRSESGKPRFDACVLVGEATRTELAPLVPGDAEWMQALPTFHLTHQPPKSRWASIVLSPGTKTGLAEHVASWLLDLEPDVVSKQQAHTLLAGILASSNSFRSSLVTSDTFDTSSELVRRGADRQAIIHALWRTVPVHDLNLWGRAMMRLQPHATLPITSTLISAHDLLQTKSSQATIPALTTYLLDRLEHAQALLVFSADASGTRVHLATRAPYTANLIARWFAGDGNERQATWVIATSDLIEAQQQVLQLLERELPRLT